MAPNMQMLVRNSPRFEISALSIVNETATGVTSPSVTIKHGDDAMEFLSTAPYGRPVEFVFDPHHHDLVLKIPYSAKIQFQFKIRLVPPIDSVTFISASNTKQLETFLSTELFHNPNIQNEDNVMLLGDFKVTAGSGPIPRSVDFTWTWTDNPDSIHGSSGRKALCFAEYDKRDHRLSELAAFTIWIEQPPSAALAAEISPTNPLHSLQSPLIMAVASPTPAPTSSTDSSSIASTSPVNIKQQQQSQQLPIALSPPLGLSSNAPPVPSVTRHQSIASSIGSNFSITTSPSETQPSSIPSQDAVHQHTIDLVTMPETPSINNANTISGETIDGVLEREKKASSVPRPTEGDNNHQQGVFEDGPLFRATVTSLEKKNTQLKALIKKILKRAILVYERQEAHAEALRVFDDALRDASEHDVPGFQDLMQSYFNKRAPYNGLLDLNRGSGVDFKQHVIEPLRRLYEQEIKTAELRKREFDDESAQYYSWLSRYLSMKQEAKGKKKSDSDSKYLEKRKTFELTRFDYYSFLSDLHGGRKQLDVIYHLALYAEAEMSRLFRTSDSYREKVKPDLDLVVTEIKEAHKDWSRHRTQRETQRRALEQPTRKTMVMSPGRQTGTISQVRTISHDDLSSEDDDECSMATPTVSHKLQPLVSAATITTSTSLRPLPIYEDEEVNSSFNSVGELSDLGKLTIDTSSPNVSISNGGLPTPTISSAIVAPSGSFSDLQVNDSHRKEGLLWSMSRPGDPLANLNKAGWHKYWVVLAGGKLCEYTNWKQSLDLHNEPVNLKTACVREGRTSDRRFVFEVVTPSFKRLYQATSDEDMKTWMRAIQNGINSSLNNDTDAHTGMKNELTSNDNFYTINGASGKPPGAQSSSTNSNGNASKIGRALTIGHGPGSGYVGEDLLKIIQQAPSNRQCADCGGTERVEWVSINLLVILCIDCSGVHRSLGSHISKIRSLTLDIVSFTPELIELLKRVSNAQLNAVWEEGMKVKKPYPLTNRLGFITEKYVEKKYIRTLDRPNAHLRKAVAVQDLIEILRSLASRANPNVLVTDAENGSPTTSNVAPTAEEGASSAAVDGGISLLLYAFKCAPKGAAIFPVVELLILNGAQPPQDFLPIPSLSDAANRYLKYREALLSRKLTVVTNSSSTSPSIPPQPSSTSMLLSPDKRVGNMGAKLQKRLSTGFNKVT